MQTKHYIPLTGKFEGWAIIDFVMAMDAGEVETRAVVLDPEGWIHTRSLMSLHDPRFRVAPVADFDPLPAGTL